MGLIFLPNLPWKIAVYRTWLVSVDDWFYKQPSVVRMCTSIVWGKLNELPHALIPNLAWATMVCSYYTYTEWPFHEPTMLPLVQPGTCTADKQRSRGQISLILVSGSSIRNLPGVQRGPLTNGSVFNHGASWWNKIGRYNLGSCDLCGAYLACTWSNLGRKLPMPFEFHIESARVLHLCVESDSWLSLFSEHDSVLCFMLVWLVSWLSGLGGFTWATKKTSPSTGPVATWDCWEFCGHRWSSQDDW